MTAASRRLTRCITPVCHGLSEVKRAGDLRGQARLCGGLAPYASRWKTVRPTEEAYQLADEYYRYAARRDLGLPPARDVTLPRLCNACEVSVAADGRHGQRCIYNSSYTKLRHDSITKLRHDSIVDSIEKLVLPSCLFSFANQIGRSVTHVLSGSRPRRRSLSSRHARAVFGP